MAVVRRGVSSSSTWQRLCNWLTGRTSSAMDSWSWKDRRPSCASGPTSSSPVTSATWSPHDKKGSDSEVTSPAARHRGGPTRGCRGYGLRKQQQLVELDYEGELVDSSSPGSDWARDAEEGNGLTARLRPAEPRVGPGYIPRVPSGRRGRSAVRQQLQGRNRGPAGEDRQLCHGRTARDVGPLRVAGARQEAGGDSRWRRHRRPGGVQGLPAREGLLCRRHPVHAG